MVDLDKLCFLVSWDDKVSGNVRQFHLNFYPTESAVEMFDLRTKKTFLKKTVTDQVEGSDLFVGNTVKLFSRVIKVLDFGDDLTRDSVSPGQEATLGLLVGPGLSQMGEVVTRVQQEGDITLARARMVRLTEMQARELCQGRGEHEKELVARLISGCCLALELVGREVVSRWRKILEGEENSDEGERLGLGSVSVEGAERELGIMFPGTRLGALPSLAPPLTHWSGSGHTTCCLVLPHMVSRVGQVITSLREAGEWQVMGLQTFHLALDQAQEFLEVYKGVVPEYGEMVAQLSSGMCLVMEVGRLGGEGGVVERFREFCGPRDPQTAKLLRPGTLRARFGETVVKNGVHCTDLPEDGPLEVEYFFKVLQ